MGQEMEWCLEVRRSSLEDHVIVNMPLAAYNGGRATIDCNRVRGEEHGCHHLGQFAYVAVR